MSNGMAPQLLRDENHSWASSRIWISASKGYIYIVIHFSYSYRIYRITRLQYFVTTSSRICIYIYRLRKRLGSLFFGYSSARKRPSVRQVIRMMIWIRGSSDYHWWSMTSSMFQYVSMIMDDINWYHTCTIDFNMMILFFGWYKYGRAMVSGRFSRENLPR